MKNLFLLLTVLLTLSAAQSQVYTDKTAEFTYSAEKPGYLDIKEVEVTKTGSKAITFKVTFNEELPRKSEFRNLVWFYLDIDGSKETGQAASYDASFCYDNVIAIARPANELKFGWTANKIYSNASREDNEVTIKEIRSDKNTLTVEVSTKLFLSVPSIKFNVSTAIGVMDEKKSREDEVTQRKTIDWLSPQKGLEFKLP